VLQVLQITWRERREGEKRGREERERREGEKRGREQRVRGKEERERREGERIGGGEVGERRRERVD
jgi:hypothetical protein